jgi:hypothetical protein
MIMGTKTFRKEDLQALAADEAGEGFERVSDTIIEHSRWSVLHAMTFKDTGTGRYYSTHYSVGATEQQDESPYEHEGDAIDCVEVRPVEKVVTVYEPIP